MTETRVSYDEKLGKRALIKHQNLAKLKYSYKKSVHA